MLRPEAINEKIGTFYNSGMDTVTIEQKGISPLKIFFDKIESIKNIADVQSCWSLFPDLPDQSVFLSSSQIRIRRTVQV